MSETGPRAPFASQPDSRAPSYREASPTRFRRVVEWGRKPYVQPPEVKGRENLEKLPPGEVPIVAYFHGNSNQDGPLVIKALGNDLNFVASDWSSNRQDPIMRVALKVGGAENFSPIATQLKGAFAPLKTNEVNRVDQNDYAKLIEAMNDGKVPLVAAQRRGLKGEVSDNSGFAVPLLAQLSEHRTVLPVGVDVYDRVGDRPIDHPLTVLRNIAKGSWRNLTRLQLGNVATSRPRSTVTVHEPIELEPIPKEDVELLLERRFSADGRTRVFSDEEKARADETFIKLRRQGDQVLLATIKDIPDSRLGKWVNRVRALRGPRPPLEPAA